MSATPPPSPQHGLSVPQNTVGCPHCRTYVPVQSFQTGTMVLCPRCGNKFQLPGPGGHAGANPYYGGQPNQWQIQQFASKKVAAGICGILLGGMGVHKFILGFGGAGAIMLVIWLVGIITGACLVVPIVATIAMNVIGLVEGIIYLTKSDEEFFYLYAVQKRQWF